MINLRQGYLYSVLVGVAFAWLPFVFGCNQDGSFQQRLAATVARLERTSSSAQWANERCASQLDVLRPLRGKRLTGPHILYAALLPHKNGPVLVVDYVDTQPRAELFRLYAHDRHLMDFTESDDDRRLNRQSAEGEVLYSAVYSPDVSEPALSGVWDEESLWVELHNPGGVVTPRVQVQRVVFSSEADDAGDKTEDGSE